MHRFGFFTSVFLIALASPPAYSAQDARTLTGTFVLSHVTPGPVTVSATMTVRLKNLSGQALSGATVYVETSPGRTERATLAKGFELAPGASRRVQAQVTMTREEYDRWSSGGAPPIGAEWLNGEGEVTRWGIAVRGAAVSGGAK